MEDPSQHVSVADVISRFGESLSQAKELMLALLETPLPEAEASYRETLATALLTPPANIPGPKRELMEVLCA